MGVLLTRQVIQTGHSTRSDENKTTGVDCSEQQKLHYITDMIHRITFQNVTTV